MRRMGLNFTLDMFVRTIKAVSLVLAATVILVLIGRDTLGEAIIALLYLGLVVWSASSWGQGPGMIAAVMSALMFDFFFIPPFYTFAVGRIEGWLVLAIFLAVAIWVVGRIQSDLSAARASERDAIFMYELGMTLAGLRTQEAVVHALARHLQQQFNTELVRISVRLDSQSPSIVVTAPADGTASGRPDRVLPILGGPSLIGEICIWRGYGWLPPEDSRLLDKLTTVAALALERARLAELELRVGALAYTSGK